MVKCHGTVKMRKQREESSVTDWGGRWTIAVGWLLQIFTDVRAFSAKAQE